MQCARPLKAQNMCNRWEFYWRSSSKLYSSMTGGSSSFTSNTSAFGKYGTVIDATFSNVSSKLVLIFYYNDVTMGAMESQITSLTIVYSTVYSGADQRKHQSSASLAFVRGIHRSPVNSQFALKRRAISAFMLCIYFLMRRNHANFSVMKGSRTKCYSTLRLPWKRIIFNNIIPSPKIIKWHYSRSGIIIS